MDKNKIFIIQNYWNVLALIIFSWILIFVVWIVCSGIENMNLFPGHMFGKSNKLIFIVINTISFVIWMYCGYLSIKIDTTNSNSFSEQAFPFKYVNQLLFLSLIGFSSTVWYVNSSWNYLSILQIILLSIFSGIMVTWLIIDKKRNQIKIKSITHYFRHFKEYV